MNKSYLIQAAIVLVAVVWGLQVTAALAEYQQVHPCDDVAAHPSDKQKWGKGVSDADLAPPLAIKQCGDAIKQHPDTPRFHFQLGRALWIAQKYKEAVVHLGMAGEKGHTASYAFLGEAYMKGLGGLRANADKATKAFEIAARGGFEPANDALSKAQAQNYKETFSSEGFQFPHVMTAFYKGDFSELKSDDRSQRYQIYLYMLEFNRFFADPQAQFLQGQNGQNIAACRQLYDPEVERILVTDVTTRSNPFGDTVEEQGRNALARGLEMFLQMREQGVSALTEPIMNMDVTKQKGQQDAVNLVATYGCESEITKQIYRNIKPFFVGGRGVVPITDKRMANDIVQGCQAAGQKSSYCDCMLSTIIRAEVSSDDQELLAASFSEARIKRMGEKYSTFGRSGSCY